MRESLPRWRLNQSRDSVGKNVHIEPLSKQTNMEFTRDLVEYAARLGWRHERQRWRSRTLFEYQRVRPSLIHLIFQRRRTTLLGTTRTAQITPRGG